MSAVPDLMGSMSMRTRSAAPSSMGSSMKKKRKCKKRSAMSESQSKSIGFSVGGAKDVNTFRDNILKNCRIPQLESISFEGVYYDYFFDTEENELGTNDVSDNDVDDDKKEG